MLANLTGKGYDDWDLVASSNKEKNIPVIASYQSVALLTAKRNRNDDRVAFAIIGIAGVLGLIGINSRRR